MTRVFITGSADGLGALAAQQLVREGHRVVLHARNAERAKVAHERVPDAEAVLFADLANVDEIVDLAHQVNALGHFDAVIHNAAISGQSRRDIFTVNSLAPFILTALIEMPQRLIYLGSGMHTGGRARLEDMETATSYSDSKFQLLLLAKVVARRRPSVYVNVVNPGWVPTKMGGSGAPDNLEEGYATQVWLATSNDPQACVSGRYFFHKQQKAHAPDTNSTDLQDAYLARCEEITGITLPTPTSVGN